MNMVYDPSEDKMPWKINKTSLFADTEAGIAAQKQESDAIKQARQRKIKERGHGNSI